MRRRRKSRSLIVRFINSICSLTLVGALIYVFIAGFELGAGIAVAGALVAVAVPVVIAGESAFEMVVGVLEALVDGVIAICEAIGNLFNF